ncbi:MAG TPA: Bcr/CflA family drug resistance efflux transporter [Rheinheimera sp.]|nr:Bcr/CflA family drug resistance efflux transporter [Rheinheimera sp.]
MNAVKPSWWLISLLASVIAVTPLAIDMYLPAMPQIAAALSSDADAMQQSLSIYLLCYAAGMLLFGPLADVLGRRTLALFGLASFALCSFFLSQTDSIQGFLVGRGLQALLGSAATVVIPGFIRQLYQEHTAKGMSYVGIVMMLAPLVAPAVGSALLLLDDWRLIFVVLGSYALLILVLCSVYLPHTETPRQGQKPDFLGAYREVLGHRRTRPLLLLSMSASFGFFGFLTAVSFIYIGHYQVSALTFSWLFGANVVCLMLGNFINGKLVPKLGSVQLLRYTTSIALIAAAGLLLVALLDGPLWATALCIAPLMSSLGLSATNADALTLLDFPRHAGTATAVIGTLRFGAGALAGPALALGVDGALLPFALVMGLGAVGVSVSRYWFAKHAPAQLAH